MKTMLLAVGFIALVSGEMACGGGVAGTASFGISKGASYLQSADGTVNQYPGAFSAVLSLTGSLKNSFLGCDISYVGPLSPLSCIEVGNTDEHGDVWYGYSNAHENEGDLDAEIPPGDFTFDFTGNVLAGGSHLFNLRPTAFCPEIPELTADTYSRLQSYKDDLGADFAGSMGGFTDQPGADSSSSSILIFDLGHRAVYYGASFVPTETSFLIPGGSVEEGRAYFGVLYYTVSYLEPGAGVDGGSHSTSFARTTFFYFNTRGPCPADLNGDGFVDDADFVIFVQAYNLLYCSDALMPDKCAADLTNDGYVLDDDFVSFVPAYNQLLCEPE